MVILFLLDCFAVFPHPLMRMRYRTIFYELPPLHVERGIRGGEESKPDNKIIIFQHPRTKISPAKAKRKQVCLTDVFMFLAT